MSEEEKKALEKKALEEKALEEKNADIDDEIKELLKDPKALQDFVLSQRTKKREANAEAKGYRQKLEKIEKEKDVAEKKRLEDEGKFKEIAEKEKEEKEAVKAKFMKRAIIGALKLEALKQGIVDPDDVNLIDTEDVEINDEFEVENAEAIVKDFKEKKPHKFKDKKDENELTNPAPKDVKPAWKKDLNAPSPEVLSADGDIDSYFADKK